MKRTLEVAGLLVAAFTIGIGASGCKLLNEIAKTQKHAAIAYDEKTGGLGYSVYRPSADPGPKAATGKIPSCTGCLATGRLAGNEGWGALARSPPKKGMRTPAPGTTRLAAESAAKADCVAKGGGTCKVLVYACNSTK